MKTAPGAGEQLSLSFTDPAARADALLARLRVLGFAGVLSVTLTRNRSTVASISRGRLRVHESFADAADDVLRAMVTFFASRRSAVRNEARRVIVAHASVHQGITPRRRRRRHVNPADTPILEKLAVWHRELNEVHFAGLLRPIQPQLSRRMKSRLGHYSPASATLGTAAEIVLSTRHLRRDGLKRARDTLLHEMVHQWQDESGLPVDHGPSFRRKAIEVGTPPFARRPRDVSLGE
jgi:hypothetical protein